MSTAGILQIEILAGIARLSEDMKRAERIVGDSTGRMEKSVTSLQNQFNKLGFGLSIGLMIDQARRLTDSYTKITAQMRIATATQAEYAKGMEDVRRISTVAQSSIEATTMLYTRLTNSLKQHGATQQDVGRITESVSLGLKAYGATTAEAASAMLQLSQAFGSGRLGGEEFRAVAESMPNMLAALAKSMNVPASSLKQLASEGKITSEVMMKAWNDPALIASLQKQAEMTRTITGEITVFRNNLTMLVGEFMGASGSTAGITTAIRAMSDSVMFLGKNLDSVMNILSAYIGYLALMQVKSVLAWGQSRLVMMAHTQALAANAAGEVARSVVVAAAATQETAARHLRLMAQREEFIASMAATRAALAGVLTAEARTAAELKYAASIEIVTAAHVQAIAMERARTTAMVASTAAEITRTSALAASGVAAIKWGTSVSTAIAMVGTAVSAAVLANPIGAAVLAIGAITLAIVNWETIVKASKATFDGFSLMIDSLKWGAEATSISLGKMFAQIQLGWMHTTKQITTEQYRAMWKQIEADAEQAKIDLIKIQKDGVDHEAIAAAERRAADRKEWEKLTNTKAQQRQAEIEALNEHYLKIVTGQQLSQAEQLAEAARYNVALANINEKYGKAAAKAAAKELSEAMKASAKLYEEEVKARQQYADTLNNETRSIEEKTVAVLLETESIGKTKAEIDLLQAARYDHETQIMKETLATYESAVACTVEAEALKEAIAAREAYKKAQTDQSTKRANQAAIDAETKSWGDMWKKVDGFAHDAFDNIFDKGKNAFEEIGKVIKKSILDMLYKMTVQKWIFSIGATSAGVGASGMAGAAGIGGADGGSSWLSAGKSIYDGFSGAFTYSSTATTGLSGMFNSFATSSMGQSLGLSTAGELSLATGEFASSVSSFGSTVGTFGSYAGAGLAGIGIGTMLAGDKKLAGMSGSTTSTAGAIIGAIVGGPIGAAIGGALGGAINAAFGMGPKQAGTTTLAGQFGGEGFAGQYQTPWTQKGGWFRSNKSGIDVQGIGAEQQAALSALVGGTKSVFDNLIAASGDANKSIAGWTFSINRQVATQEQQNQLIIDMADSMGNYLIPALQQFQAKGENLADTAVRMRDEFILTDSVLRLVGGSFGAVGLASMGARDNLVQLMGGIQSMNTTMQSYYQNFFTDAERHANDLGALTIKFAQLGLSIPQSAAGFKQLVSSQDLSTESGRQLFAALMSLNGSFAALIPTAEAAAKAIEANIKALQDKAIADFDAARKATDSLRSFALSVRELQQALWAGSQTPLTSTYAVTRSQFAATNVLAGQGDANAQANLAGAATAFLDASKKQAMSAIEYARDFAMVQNALSDTAYKTEVAVTVADAQLTVLELIQQAILEGNAQSLTALLSVQSEINLAKLAGTLDVNTLRGTVIATTDKQISAVDTMNLSVLRVTDPSGGLITAQIEIQKAIDAAKKTGSIDIANLSNIVSSETLKQILAVNGVSGTISSETLKQVAASQQIKTEVINNAGYTAKVTDTLNSNTNPILDRMGAWLNSINTQSSIQTQSLQYLLQASITASEAARMAVVEQSITKLNADIAAAVGTGYSASNLSRSTGAAGETALSYAAAYKTVSGSVSATGVSSGVSTTVSAAQRAAQRDAAAAAEKAAWAKHKAGAIANPSAYYLADNPDVANPAAWTGTPYSHWLMYGQSEGRSWGGSPGRAGLHQFAVGTNEVPFDMIANIHAGEQITPKPYVDKERTAREETNRLLARLQNEVSQLRSDAKQYAIPQIVASQKTAKVLERWDGNGLPAERTA